MHVLIKSNVAMFRSCLHKQETVNQDKNETKLEIEQINDNNSKLNRHRQSNTSVLRLHGVRL